MSQQLASHDFAFAISSSAARIIRPEMHEEQPRLLFKHVTMQSRDLDSVCPQGFDHRVDLIGVQALLI
jgi:hypothetical protein